MTLIPFVPENARNKIGKTVENIVLKGLMKLYFMAQMQLAPNEELVFGEELARAYANMDLFIFPSQTDAFGNVVLEAMSSGVPGVVMSEGGPKFLIENNANGFIANGEKDFVETVVRLVKNPQQLPALGQAARRAAEANSWERVFEKTFEYYKICMDYKKNIRA